MNTLFMSFILSVLSLRFYFYLCFQPPWERFQDDVSYQVWPEIMLLLADSEFLSSLSQNYQDRYVATSNLYDIPLLDVILNSGSQLTHL